MATSTDSSSHSSACQQQAMVVSVQRLHQSTHDVDAIAISARSREQAGAASLLCMFVENALGSVAQRAQPIGCMSRSTVYFSSQRNYALGEVSHHVLQSADRGESSAATSGPLVGSQASFRATRVAMLVGGSAAGPVDDMGTRDALLLHGSRDI